MICAAKWKLSQPEFREKLYSEESNLKKGIAKRQWHKENQERSAGIVSKMRGLTAEQELERRAAVSRGLKAIGHRPKVRGGNGTGPTKAEWQLMRMFPEGIWNYAIKTGCWNGSGYPPVYKVDLGFPDEKLAIEADGGTHGTWDNRKEKDLKKDKFLKDLGWKVLRYSNREILDFRSSVQILADVEFIISKSRATRATASKG
jgi:hypothetical protein